MTSRPRKLVLKSKRRKRDLSNEALSNIRPYSVFPLECGGDLFLLIVKAIWPFDDFKSQVLETLPKHTQLMNFNNPDETKISYLDYFVARCLVCKNRPEIWSERPTLAEYRHDIKCFGKIKRGYIGEASQILTEKYSSLHVVSNEYVRWRSLIRSDFLFSIDSASNKRSELQIEVKQFTKNILSGFPLAEANGRSSDSLTVWLAGELGMLWKSAGYDPSKNSHRNYFYEHLLRIGKLVGANMSETEYHHEKVGDVLDGNYKDQKYRENFSPIDSPIYFGPSVWTLFSLKLNKEGVYSTITWPQFASKLWHNKLFEIRYIIHKRWGFSPPRD